MCAVMATLPQTAPGVPAEGIDPTVDELQQIGDVAGIFSWLGSEESQRTAALRVLGGGQHRLRDLVYVPADLWLDTVRDLPVPQGKTERDLTALEVGHVGMVRRIPRPRLGLTVLDEVAAAAPTPRRRTRLWWSTARGREYWLLLPLSVTAEPWLKLSVLLDPALDSELARLPQAKVREMFTDYVRLRGATPSEDIEPTLEQVSAIHQVITADVVPFADFSYFGPHGKRLPHKLTYVNWTFLPDGSWQRKEVPGRPSLEFWWASFRVYRAALRALDAGPPKILDNDGEMARGHSTLYSGAWFVVFNADVLLRSEQFERLRRKAERDHAAAWTSGGASDYDPVKPCRTMFAMAVANEEWWNENLHRPTMFYLTRIKSASTVVEDGTAPPDLRVAIEPGSGNTRRKASVHGSPKTPLEQCILAREVNYVTS